MSRIRSIHPGQWTDEEFVGLSFAARLLAIGLRNEADDNGVFEWKPVVLKMRLFPADPIDVSKLLAELVSANQVKHFSYDDRNFGAIRNFRVFQNPKSPKAQFPTTQEVEEFVGNGGGEGATPKRSPGRPRKEISTTSAPDVPENGENKPDNGKSFPQNEENNSLMERRGEEKEETTPVPKPAREKSNAAAGPDPPTPAIGLTAQLECAMEAAGMISPPQDWRAMFRAWKDAGASFDDDVLPAIRKVMADVRERGSDPPFRMKFFNDAVLRVVEENKRQSEYLRSVKDRITDQMAQQEADDAEEARKDEDLRRQRAAAA